LCPDHFNEKAVLKYWHLASSQHMEMLHRHLIELLEDYKGYSQLGQWEFILELGLERGYSKVITSPFAISTKNVLLNSSVHVPIVRCVLEHWKALSYSALLAVWTCVMTIRGEEPQLQGYGNGALGKSLYQLSQGEVWFSRSWETK
jgi:hypothetical protein